MLIISFISSFEINRVNPFPALAAHALGVAMVPCPFIFHSNLSNIDVTFLLT